MKFTVVALLALTAPLALAQSAPPPPMADKTDWKAAHARHHGDMCDNLYAHAVGKLAELDVKLKLTAAQKPLFERWKAVKLAAVKAHSAKCAAMTPPDRDAGLLEQRKLKITMLEARLSEMKAEQPSLEALVGSLDKDQQETLKRAGHAAEGMRMHFVERFMERRGPMGVDHGGPNGPRHPGQGSDD